MTAAWAVDPLDDTLLRYWDGTRWTFHTAVRPEEAAPAPEPDPVAEEPNRLRPDIAAAVEKVRGTLLGSMKEVNLLHHHLEPEERVLALTGALGEGHGVLACTDRRLLFLFVGIVHRQFLQVPWNQAREVTFTPADRALAVYTVKRTKRAVPALRVVVTSRQDAETVLAAAQAASAAPRLDIV